MLRSRFTITTLVATVAILYIGLRPVVFGLLSEIPLPHWFFALFNSEYRAHRFWSNGSVLLSILTLGVAAALVLRYFIGGNALRAAIVVGSVSIAAYALLRFAIPLPRRLTAEQEIRSWLINIVQAVAVPGLVLVAGICNKHFKERRGESHALEHYR
jgi:hypothetical protein